MRARPKEFPAPAFPGSPRKVANANFARALEMEDRVSTQEVGKLADLIVVEGDPLEDLSALEQIETV